MSTFGFLSFAFKIKFQEYESECSSLLFMNQRWNIIKSDLFRLRKWIL
ncbi:hypothetical protein LEP1GSC052_0842 [Leptospira kmetyi serovar Malaysia str. Bejo-Iso9]|nr:hypothetical protein LEP1GSC052_0842 [Leptospira kmetyi serovar Malaysia str. Bejo-Iso9]